MLLRTTFNNWLIHVLMSQVFYLLKDQHPNGPTNHTSHNRLSERLARAFCLALCQSLCLLKEDGMTKLALRVILDGQKVRWR